MISTRVLLYVVSVFVYMWDKYTHDIVCSVSMCCCCVCVCVWTKGARNI